MKYPPSAERARLSEVFSSLQGEGIHAGERHLFVRFEECHIHCRYCDELGKPGEERNLDALLAEIAELEKREGPHRFVSFTGGEPLLYLKFLKPLMQRLRERGMKNYLETDGILWPALEQVIDLCDCISMDMKPSSVTGEKNFEAEHEKFLQIARRRETYVKFVLSKDIDIPEFERLVAVVKRTAPEVPVVLQPLSSEREGHEDDQLMKLLGELQTLALQQVQDVRIIPRLHRILKIR
ncbi:MAG: 7-carboxy-7-deazaguanine synthase QueE [Candidatus Omnitrophica bacterium]|nr:7-carboxy-7-deazaguanine synthase QueE [Candidatus Omnitrophota bacterium]